MTMADFVERNANLFAATRLEEHVDSLLYSSCTVCGDPESDGESEEG